MSIYRQSTLGTSSNQITFNKLGSYPYYRMTMRQPTRREIVEFDIKLPETTGDADYQTLIGKTYLILGGTMYPNDEASYDRGRRLLRKLASLEIEQADAESDQGYVPYKWSDAEGIDKQLFVKVLDVDIPESSHNGLKQPFRMLCKIKYPVIFSQQVVQANVGLGTSNTSSGIGYPFLYPVLYGATTYSSSGSIVNGGDLPTYPSNITVYGPINQPKLTNSSTGEYLQFNVNLPTVNDSLVINYDQDSLSATVSGESVLSALTSGSSFFKLQRGNNNFSLTGNTIGSGAYATVSAMYAWPLS